jgi:selenocysteine lyase/cysteine desulfurase
VTTFSATVVKRLRDDTPGTAHRIHLNNAGAALMPTPVVAAIEAHLRCETEIGGYEAADAVQDETDGAYDAVAHLIGAASRNVAMVENATAAFTQAISAIPLERGDVIVTTRNDYISNQILFFSLARRFGIEVRRAAELPEGGADAESVADLAGDRRSKLVAVTWVPTNSGLVQPVEAIGEACDRLGVPYVVDGCQAVGQMPTDVRRLRCDYLSATARKFLRGPRGVGFLYVSDRALERGDHPLFPDMRGAHWTEPDAYEPVEGARRFENWEFAYALVLGLGAAARYATDVGVAPAGERAVRLAARARDALASIDGVRVLDRGARQCAIVTAAITGCDGDDVVHALRERGINTSSIRREFAVLDMNDKKATSGVRISPHYYNTEAEVDQALEAIREIVRDSCGRPAIP